MPSADPDLVRKIEEYSGETEHGGLDHYCQAYLKQQGYVEERFHWKPKPGVTNVNEMTQQEYDCMWYLVTEWDWGGLIASG